MQRSLTLSNIKYRLCSISFESNVLVVYVEIYVSEYKSSASRKGVKSTTKKKITITLRDLTSYYPATRRSLKYIISYTIIDLPDLPAKCHRFLTNFSKSNTIALPWERYPKLI